MAYPHRSKGLPQNQSKNGSHERGFGDADSADLASHPASGVALFMVLGAISVLAILVVEFTYISQVNQTIAYGALDQVQAHYLAKSGLKLSLLRLKAYQKVKDLLGTLNKQTQGNPAAAALSGGGAPNVPKQLVEKIWNFPFIYPLPTDLPGMSIGDKETIQKFTKESGLEGNFTAVIDPESSKYNINMLLSRFFPNANPSPSASPSSGSSSPDQDPATSATPSPSPSVSPSPSPSFNPEIARQSLGTFIDGILIQKFENDPDFASFYRDLRLEELIDNIAAWADPSYERRMSSNQDPVPMKQGPFFSISELHALSTIDDDLYDVLAPSFTVLPSGGINVNTIKKETLQALIPNMTLEEVDEFFKYRDDPQIDNTFQNPEQFFQYLKNNVAIFQDTDTITNFQKELDQRGLRIVTEESAFKITVKANVKTANTTIEAWVLLSTPVQRIKGVVQRPTNQPPPISGPGAQQPQTFGSESGLTITLMRIL